MDARRRATLRDVAAVAGVSVKTASRVVNKEPGVVAAKVTAVRRAVAQLDYRRDLGASALRRTDGRTAAVAVLLEDLANPYSAALHRAIEDAAWAEGALVFAGSVDEDSERERQLVREFTARRADGLIVVPASDHHEYLEREVGPRTPVVFVDRPPVGYAADAVLTDNAASAARAVDHLVRHGHRRIAMLGDSLQIATARERRDGFLAAADRHGLPRRREQVVHGLSDEVAAGTVLRRMLAGAEPPTALFTAQNEVTTLAVRVLQHLGAENEIALVGFDDLPWADLVRPGITVVAQDPTAVGRRAAQILFGRLAGDRGPVRTEVVGTTLVERGSGELRPPSSP